MNNPKWGQPQAVAGGEPVDRVFIVATGEEHEGEATYTRYDHVPPPLCDSECLYAAPPPAVVEPLLEQHHRDSKELRKLCAERDQARRERDVHKAEIAGLEASCSTLGKLVDELRADSERLEWVLRRCHGTWLRAHLGVVSDTGDMEMLRTLIDANRDALSPAHGIKGDEKARELLELAARAAGKAVKPGAYDASAGLELASGVGYWWNPLKNDGDAFLLACALEIDVTFRVVTTVRVEALAPGGPRITVPYKGASERAAAARLAITQAAAAKGRATP